MTKSNKVPYNYLIMLYTAPLTPPVEQISYNLSKTTSSKLTAGSNNLQTKSKTSNKHSNSNEVATNSKSSNLLTKKQK